MSFFIDLFVEEFQRFGLIKKSEEFIFLEELQNLPKKIGLVKCSSCGNILKNPNYTINEYYNIEFPCTECNAFNILGSSSTTEARRDTLKGLFWVRLPKYKKNKEEETKKQWLALEKQAEEKSMKNCHKCGKPCNKQYSRKQTYNVTYHCQKCNLDQNICLLSV